MQRSEVSFQKLGFSLYLALSLLPLPPFILQTRRMRTSIRFSCLPGSILRSQVHLTSYVGSGDGAQTVTLMRRVLLPPGISFDNFKNPRLIYYYETGTVGILFVAFEPSISAYQGRKGPCFMMSVLLAQTLSSGCSRGLGVSHPPLCHQVTYEHSSSLLGLGKTPSRRKSFQGCLGTHLC